MAEQKEIEYLRTQVKLLNESVEIYAKSANSALQKAAGSEYVEARMARIEENLFKMAEGFQFVYGRLGVLVEELKKHKLKPKRKPKKKRKLNSLS